ncbi:MAG: type I-E CRISPR-associated endonuclease Cas1e [Thermoguttaceae bacterium]|nr:type I-E CRISPR-associated endonuclease Cas1e [Thermoguttaceae bacterium]
MGQPLIIRTQLSDIPMLRDRYPFLYLEHGRMEIDDSSVKWISADGKHFRLPAAEISTILLGPGTSITHEAVKILASLNATVCWVGDDSLIFYAVGQAPTANTYNLKKQLALAADPEKSLAVAKKMFASRFPQADIRDKPLKELMVMEGQRVKACYLELAEKYKVGWKGRAYVPGEFQLSDMTNKLITSSNAALYALCSSIIYSLGFDPRVGFIHSGSPLPFVYDVADLYKEDLVFDLAFSLTAKMCGEYDRYKVLEEFKNRLLEYDFMGRCTKDVLDLMGIKKQGKES